MPRSTNLSPNMASFLDAIAWSEIGPALLDLSDDGYNVVVGSTPQRPILFDDYSRHPRIRRYEVNSDAAGRYQFMGRYWEHYKRQLDLPDFGPESQDKWAIQLIRECKAIDMVESGMFDNAINACRSRWASFPGAGYGQHEHELDSLRMAYTQAGGTLGA